MGWTITSAIAPTFAWTASSADFRFTFSGHPTFDVVVASGTYRMCLGPSAGDGQDFIRAAQTAINAAFAAEGLTDTAALAISSTGTVTMFLSSSAVVASGQGMRALGLAAGTGAIFAGTVQPQHIAFAVSQTGTRWKAEQTGAVARLSDGSVQSFGTAITTHVAAPKLDYIPRTPTDASEASSPATSWHPDRAYWSSLGNTGSLRAWSWLDLYRDALNVECAVALGTWQQVYASTTEAYDLAYFAEPLGPEQELRDESWNRYVTHTLKLSLASSAPTGTRA